MGVQHDKLGYELLDKLAGEMDEVCTREGRPKREGRNLSMIVTPPLKLLSRSTLIEEQKIKRREKRKNNGYEIKRLRRRLRWQPQRRLWQLMFPKKRRMEAIAAMI